MARYGSNDWSKVCQKLRTQQITPEQCQMRWEQVLRDQTVKVALLNTIATCRDRGVKRKTNCFVL